MTATLHSAAWAALSFAMAANALAAEDSRLKLSGFATLGVVHSTETEADFVTVQNQPNGAGHTRDWSFSNDSKVGGQGDLAIVPRWSAKAQVVAQVNSDNNWRPELMLFFLKWQATPTFAARIGRMYMPLFPISDYRLVGYSLPWVRPPTEIYGNAGLFHFDGADLTWMTPIEDATLKSQVFLGRQKSHPAPDVTFESRLLYGFNTTWDAGETTLRLGYQNFDRSTITNPAAAGLLSVVRSGLPPDALGPGSPAIPPDPASADRFDAENTLRSVRYLSLGAGYDPGPWFVSGEFAVLKGTAFLPDNTNAFATVGWRFGPYTPYGVLARAVTAAPEPTGHPILDPVVAGIAATTQTSAAVGLRWEANRSTALKLQLDRVKPAGGQQGMLTNLQPGYVPGRSYSLISASIDVVF